MDTSKTDPAEHHIIERHARAAESKKKLSEAVAIVADDEKPGIQAIATMAPTCRPRLRRKPAIFRRGLRWSEVARLLSLLGTAQ